MNPMTDLSLITPTEFTYAHPAHVRDAADEASQQVTMPTVPLEQYAKLQAGFLALQAAQTTATELSKEYERLRLELVAANQRRVKLEAALDLLRKSFASISQLLD